MTSRPAADDSAAWRGLLIIAFANLSRERLRSTLVLITILLATLLFLTSLGSLSGFRKPITDMLENQRASHALLDFDTRIYEPDTIAEWWRGQEGVASLTPFLPFVVTPSRPVHEGKELGSYLKLTERAVEPMEQDRLVFLDGEESLRPAHGEIWLPSSVARSAGVQPGDVLQIPTGQGARALTVGAIVVDPHYSSGFLNPERAWIAPGALVSLYPADALHNYTLGVRLERHEDLDTLWADFNASLGGGFSGSYLSYDAVVNSYSFMVRMAAMMLLAFAVISLFVALFIISSTISSEILSNYRSFGILKSLGYTPRNVTSIFQLQFMLLSAVAIPLGILGSYFATSGLIGLMLESIGAAGTKLNFLGPAAATFGLVILLIVAIAGIAGRKAGRIKPASSIRFGAPESSVRRSWVHLRWARVIPLSFTIALKNLASGSRRQLYDFISVLATAFVLLFSVNLYYSMTMTDENLPFWGLDGADVKITRDASVFGLRYGSLLRYLQEDVAVKAVAGQDGLNVIVPATEAFAARDLSGHVIDGFLDDVGYINLVGRNPAAVGEVSLGVTLARDYGIEVGDDFDLIVFGQNLSFTVTGIFQGSSNAGYWYRTTADSVRRANPRFDPGSFLIVLEDGADRDRFMSEVEAQLGQAVDAEPSEKLVESQLNSIVRSLGLVLGFLSAIFLLVAGVSISNSTAIGIHESKRQLGIFKALGYTQTQVRLIMVAKSVIMGLAAIVFGALLFWLFAGTLMNSLTMQMGMSAFPMMTSVPGSLLVVPVVVLVALAGAWIPSGKITRIKPRVLILE